jgi:transcriptional regulator with XRE-family HTH domain
MSAQSDERGIPVDTFELRLAMTRFHAGCLSAHEAAMRVGVSGQTWRNWEHGVHSEAARRPAMLNHIARQLRVDHDWLEGGGPLVTPPSPGGGVTKRYPHSLVTPRNFPVTSFVDFSAA